MKDEVDVKSRINRFISNKYPLRFTTTDTIKFTFTTCRPTHSFSVRLTVFMYLIFVKQIRTTRNSKAI